MLTGFEMKIKSKMLHIIVPQLKQRSGKYFSPFTVGYQQFKSFRSEDVSETDGIDNAEKSTNIPKNPKGNRKVIEALAADDAVHTHQIPIHIMTKKLRSKNLYLVDKHAADHFSSLIASDLRKTNSTVIEVNSGLGFLTEKLLEAGVSRLELYEKEAEFLTCLASVAAKFPNRLSISNRDFLSISNLAYSDSATNTLVLKSIFGHIKKRKWVDEPSMYIVGALTRQRFLYYLRHLLISGYLSDYGRAALYIAVLPSFSLAFGDTRHTKLFHSPNNIMLQLLFTHEILGSLPRRAFLPWPADNIRKRQIKYFEKDNELLHVIKLVPKRDFFTDDFTKHDAETFYYFLILHLIPSNLRVITTFEKWIPDCGPRLIKLDFNIFSKFNELSGLQMLNLFKAFRSWPEYENAAFLGFVDDMKSRRVSTNS